MAELLLEPVDHPVAAEDLHFGAVRAGTAAGYGGMKGVTSTYFLLVVLMVAVVP
jgi:hypothetical protein